LNGVLTQQTEECRRSTYTARNDDATPRRLLLEHPVTAAWTPSASVEPLERSGTAYRYVLPVAARQTASLVVDESRPVESTLAVSQLTDSTIELFVRDRVIDPEVTSALRGVLARKAEIAALDADLAARRQEIDRIGADQERLRENMKALKGTAEEKPLLQRYVAQLTSQENRIEVLRGETAALTARRQAGQRELDALVRALAIDANAPAGARCGAP
jgi:hypothetical protein